MNRVLVVSIALLMATLPFSHTAALVRLLLAIAVVATLLIALRTGLRWRALAPAFTPSYIAWAGWAAMSLGWSIDADYTASELRTEFFYGTLIIVAAHFALLRDDAERIVMPVLAAVSAALGVLALGWFIAYGSVEGPRVPFGGPGNLSSAVLTLFPVACAAALAPGAGQATRRMGFAMALALLVAALTTLNRTVWPALAVEIVIVAALLRPAGQDARRLAALAVPRARAGLRPGGRHAPRALRRRDRGRRGPRRTRRPAARAVGRRRRAHRRQAAHRRGATGRGILRNEWQRKFDNHLTWHAHNVFLDAGVQLGLPGIVLLAALLLAVALNGWRLARSPDIVARLSGAALVAVVAGMVVRNMTDDLWARQNALLFWAVVAGLAGLGLRRARAATSS